MARLNPPLRYAFFVFAWVSIAACSGGGAPANGTDSGMRPGMDASQGDAAADGGPGGDSGPGNDGGGDAGTDSGEVDSGPVCKTECAQDDCGERMADGCGGFLDCKQACPEGQGCGLLRADKCDFPPPAECEPAAAAEVCDGLCGAVSDGCSGVVDCSAADNGLTCDTGFRCEGNACVENVGSCTPKDAEEVCAGKCGLVSDGCSELIDCTGVTGSLTCDSGFRCAARGDARNTCEEIPPPECTPKTPAEACAGTCGVLDDGCGDQIDCKAEGLGCTAPETCGGGGVTGQCGESAQACTPLTAAEACAGKCGSVSDGCEGGYVCNAGNGGVSCDAGQGESCGGAGVSNECGAPPCEPLTMNQACPDVGDMQSCGTVPDGCNGTITCSACPSGEFCGLGGPNLCAEPSCLPTPVATACDGKCGTVADGCGGSYACNGSNGGVVCSGGEFCGANVANECGTPPVTCTPETCADKGHSCGLASDGCGNVINCWPGCDEGDTSCAGGCGDAAACLADFATGSQACVSGAPACSGSLCDDLPTSCGSSPTRLSGTVRTPGRGTGGDAVNRLPVPNALVYIPAEPSSALPDIFEGVEAGNSLSCGRCDDEQLVADGESVLAAAVTDYKGDFTLEGRIPVGVAFHLVVKIGKWRRVVSVPAGEVEACATSVLDHDYTRLAANSSDGLAGTHLPKIAVSTGSVDAMECVFRNMGIAESEFTVPSQSGRVHMYRANGARMAGTSSYQCTGGGCSGSTETQCLDNWRWWCEWEQVTQDISVADSNLFGSQDTLNDYDLVIWDCEGAEHSHGAEAEGRVANYVNNGGRMFASHYSYVWIENHDSLSPSSSWGSGSHDTSDTGLLSMASGANQRAGANPVKSALFRNWLDWQGALATTTAGGLDEPSSPQFTITDPRDWAGASVGPATDEWVYRTRLACSNEEVRGCEDDGDCRNGGTCESGERVQQLSFNTPYDSAEDQLCGRVAYSGFHVTAPSGNYFPDVCSNGELDAQEKVLAFMLFDLATCVSAGDPPTAPECTPQAAADVCPEANDACGYLLDGCGGVVDCGDCGAGYYCAGTQCRPQECTPSSCSSLGFNCGYHADGCGGVALNSQGLEGCGDCSSGQFCGLGGAGLCGTPACTPIDYGIACPAGYCGLVSNGCGGTYDCGSCADGDVCGGGGANQCGPGSCAALSKDEACSGLDCGLVSDGCGDTYQCGTCTAPDSCGGGGVANVCGSPQCEPYTEQEACDGLECGWVSDGCGAAIQCGTCPNGGVCGGAGPNLCGDSCAPTTCAMEGAQCGAISDGCGGVLQCGQCPTGQTCGAAGPNMCGSGPPCTPLSCAASGMECGLAGDGCGAVLDCGTCTTAGETCGGAGVANQCDPGMGGCDPLTCDDYTDVECGAASDGCGGLLDCGGCAQGYKCERNACVVIII